MGAGGADMMLSFSLSMPRNNSWNGRWTGEDRCHVRVLNFGSSKKNTEKAKAILDKGYFTYSFGDGWVAGITVKQVSASEAASLRRRSVGFCGYDWMIESIKDNLTIKRVGRP